MPHDGEDDARRDRAENTQTGQWARQARKKNRIGRRRGDDQLPQRWHKQYANAPAPGRRHTQMATREELANYCEITLTKAQLPLKVCIHSTQASNA